MAVPSTLRLELVWRLQGADWAVNVLHYTTGTAIPVTADSMAPVAFAISAAFGTSGMDDAYSSQTQLNRFRVRDLRADGLEVQEFVINSTGLNGGPPMPRQTCIVTKLQSTFFGRKGRGRIFWPAPANNQVGTNGLAIAALTTAVTTFTNNLMLLPAGPMGNIVLGVYSRVDGVTRSVINTSTDNSFDMQTRRRDTTI